MRIPLLAGRFFTSADTLNSQGVVIVSATFARQTFGSLRSALGKQVVIGVSATTRDYPVRTIIGIAGDATISLEDSVRGEAYMPITQLPWMRSFVIRTDGSRADLAQAVGTAIRQIDPQLATTGGAVSLSTMLEVSDGDVRASTVMLGTTAIVALLLALAGIYAVVAYGVARRTHEFGIRAALGARPSVILRGVLCEALRTSAIGIAAGVVLAVPLCSVLANAIPSGTVGAFDPLAFIAVVVLLVAATLIAAWIPARRAMRVQPSVALRYE
jgi:putative ABC transport system permease protein